MSAAARPIGVFDSGIGGLTVLREIRRLLPGENIVYFGDTARVPYGNKSAETVRTYAEEIGGFLLAKKVKAMVVACNTATAMALGHLRERFPSVPIFGVIEPGVLRALAVTRNRKIAVIGTVATVWSSAYKKDLLSRDRSLKVFQKACPLFVPLVEEGWAGHRVAGLIAEEYLAELKSSGADTLVLGCTHYPILKSVIRKVMGPKVRLVDSAEEMALNIHAYLSAEGLARKGKGRMECWLSDCSEHFVRTAASLLREKVSIRLKRF
jgi:glutamate racemase